MVSAFPNGMFVPLVSTELARLGESRAAARRDTRQRDAALATADASAPQIGGTFLMEQGGGENVFALFSAKYTNFCARFAPELKRVGATAPSIDAVLNGLTIAKPYHPLLRAHDKNSIVELLGMSDFAHAPSVVAELQAMPPEKEALLWRYVDFFLDCLGEL